jgi:transcription initiation factor TFIIF subunit beta
MNGIKEDPDVKMEPAYMDDEFFEDTGEMTLPKREVEKDVWLTRIPDWLYEAVSKWDDLAEGNDRDQIQIGEVYAFATTSGIDKSKPMRLFFDERWRNKTKLPTAFQLDPAAVTDTVLGNTYVFTEKDLPGFKGGNYGHYNRGGHGSFGGVQDPKARIQKRSKYKKAIPKQTALVGHATRQYNANPLDTREYKDFSAQRIKQAIQGSHTATVITKEIDVDVKNTTALNNKFKNFIRPLTKPKSQLNKAARISRNELIDILHGCFDEYEYWPMKALKNKTHQPEQFLKECLAEIAVLVKSGSFASTWKRMEMFDKDRDTTTRRQEEAIVKDEESDGEEMEDVV